MIRTLTALARDPSAALHAAAELGVTDDAGRFVSQLVPKADNPQRRVAGVGDNPALGVFDAHESTRRVYKWRHYFDAYHRHFSRFVGAEVHVLEIGILDGGSLEMWREYFGPRAVVYGVDLEAKNARNAPEFARIFVGDQADRHLWVNVRREVPRLDIVVDDGGHTYEQQRATFEELFPHLSDDGVYCCEDIHGRRHDTVAYFARLARELHAMDIESPPDHDGRLIVRPTFTQRMIGSVHVYPFMTFVERTSLSHLDRFVAEKKGTLGS